MLQCGRESEAFLFAYSLATLLGRASCVYDAVNHIEHARLYGNIEKYAYWFVDLIVGTPPQRTSVILDTGSGLTGFPCTGCGHCGAHIDSSFDVSKSSTFRWMSCATEDGCGQGQCSEDHCTYRQSYLEGSSISGWWFHDSVALGDAIQHNPSISTRMGCHRNEDKLFYTQEANGIFGIQGSRTLLQSLFEDSQNVQAKIFSICLNEWGGQLTVGGFDASLHTSQVQYVQPTGLYRVPLESMIVNGQTITGFRSSIIDSGTTYTYFGSEPYNGLKGAIESACGGGACKATRDGTCWKTQEGSVSSFPMVNVGLAGNVVLTWSPEAYLFRRGNAGNTWCYAFENDGAGAATTLGASWMLFTDVIFDLQSNRIGFASAACPRHVDRPVHPAGGVDLTTVTQPATIGTTSPEPASATSKSTMDVTSTMAATTPSTPTPELNLTSGSDRFTNPPPALVGGSVVAALVLCLCCALCCRYLLRRYRQVREVKHKQLKDGHESSMPPNIVPGTFEIVDDDAFQEEDYDLIGQDGAAAHFYA